MPPTSPLSSREVGDGAPQAPRSRTMIVGTAGHVDHGKTSLVRALTGVDTDRLKEEKARGISIDLGFAYEPAPSGAMLGFVDVPGHERFIHNMLAGISGIDYVLLVVAADDGIMPQTVEHLAIVDLLGIGRGLAAITKTDLVPPSRRIEVAADLGGLLAGTGLAGIEIVEVSTVTGEGLDTLRTRLHAAAGTVGAHAAGGRFRLAVDRSFTLPGAGTIVTGTVFSGTVSVGDRVLVSPSGRMARVRSLHAQSRPAEQGCAGDRCALNLVGEGITKEAISRGDVILDPELHAPTARIDARLRVLPTEPKALHQWMPARFHHGAAELGARIVLLGDAPLPPGSKGWVQLVLDRPVAASAGDSFILRDVSAQRTIGGGRLVDLRAPTRKRGTPERLAQLDALAITDPASALARLLEGRPGYVDLAGFARDRALATEEIAAVADRLHLIRLSVQSTTFALLPNVWTRLRRVLADDLSAFHAENPDLQGMGRERLRLRIEPRLPESAFAAALQSLARLGEIAIDGAWVRLPGHQARLTAEHEALWTRVHPLLGDREKFRPPRVRDIAGLLGVSESDIRRLLKLVSRMGRVYEVAHDHFFLRGALAEIVQIALRVAGEKEGGQFTAAHLRDRLGNGRKVAIQILEFMDRHGVTLRRGDLRRISHHRLDLFGDPGAETGQTMPHQGREASPVGRPDFKSGKGREPVLGGFDPHSLPPSRRGSQ